MKALVQVKLPMNDHSNPSENVKILKNDKFIKLPFCQNYLLGIKRLYANVQGI